jgi:hypothetical protein
MEGWPYGSSMARMGRVVAEGMPHHITQRGNRRQKTFFSDEDCAAYIDLMTQWCRKYGVDYMGLLFDAEPCSFDGRAWKEGESQAGHRGGASPIYPSYQFQGRLAWTLVNGDPLLSIIKGD